MAKKKMQEYQAEVEISKEVGKRLRRARRVADLTQKQVAAELGILSTNTVWNYEQGNTQIPTSRLILMAKLYGVTPASLLPDDTTPCASL